MGRVESCAAIFPSMASPRRRWRSWPTWRVMLSGSNSPRAPSGVMPSRSSPLKSVTLRIQES